MLRRRTFGLLIAAVLAIAVSPARAEDRVPQPALDGRTLLDAKGEPLLLRGVNLGGWLLIEPWMLGWGSPTLPSQHDVIELFTQRFGAERAQNLIDAWRENFMRADDFDIIRSFGMNCVRLPIHYSVLESADSPGTLRDDAFRWIDWVVDHAERTGLYVVLDLHGAPGGQSTDAPTGRTGHNTLWTDTSAQDRTVALWRALAHRYRDHPAVAVYDLLNEPYGRFDASHDDALVALMDRLVKAVREIDSVTPIIVPGSLSGIEIYGPATAHGWESVGFTEHYYPGIFGGEPRSLMQHARFERSTVEQRTAMLQEWDAWLFVGEFNPIFEHVGGARMARRQFDLFSDRGWGATIWSYKLLKPEAGVHPHNWYMVTNAEPWRIDPYESSYEEILGAFEGLRDIELAIDEEFRRVMTADATPSIPMPRIRSTDPGPFGTRSAGSLSITDVGEVGRGSVATTHDGFIVAGGGHDIWATSDSFTFLNRPAEPEEHISVTLTRFDANDRYAKAGVMLRTGTSDSAPHIFIHAFPDGRIIMADRASAGGSTRERVLAATGFPVTLSMTTDPSTQQAVLAYHGAGGVSGHENISTENIGDDAQIGVAVLGHDGANRAVAWFHTADAQRPSNCPITRTSHSAEGPPRVATTTDFELVKCTEVQPCDDDVWKSWGSVRPSDRTKHGVVMNRNSGLWQDLELELNQALRIEADIVLTNPTPDDQYVDLRLEIVDPDRPGETLRLAEKSWPMESIARSPGWSRLRLDAFPATTQGRVVLSTRGGDGRRDEAIAVRRLSVTAQPDAREAVQAAEAPR
ncbi:MAG: cellulase family glycosylhydrolase [Planctomycetota bacterium]